MAERFEQCLVRSNQRMLDAMWALERAGFEICLVVDNEGRLVGTLTEGDIRRAFLAAATFESCVEPYCQKNFLAVSPGTSRSEVLDLMRARTIAQVPVLDAERRPVAIHLLREILGHVQRANWGVVMAGGKGTRLLPITENVPKPMLRVAGRPILERIVLHLAGHGIKRVFLAINHLGDVIERHFGDGSAFGCRIEYLREVQPLGTGGALSLLPETPAQPVLVMNGDLISQVDIGAMLDFHTGGTQAATIGVRPYSVGIPFGCVVTDGDRVVQLQEKPRIDCTVNAGIYVLEPRLIARLSWNQEMALPTLITNSLECGDLVRTYEIQDDWIDVGQKEHLAEARGGVEYAWGM